MRRELIACVLALALSVGATSQVLPSILWREEPAMEAVEEKPIIIPAPEVRLMRDETVEPEPVATAMMVREMGLAVQPEASPETEADDLPEPNEEELINEALKDQGYLRDDVPLSYTLQDILHTECEINGVPYELALGVIDVESGFNLYADSGPCVGLMQLSKRYYPGKAEPLENIRAGVSLLGEKYRQTGNWGAALCSYNKGHDDGSRAYANRVFERARRWGWDGCP